MTAGPWPAAHLVLAGALGIAIGWPAAPAWLSTLGVLAAVVLGVLRPADRAVWAAALTVLLVTATAAGVLSGDRRTESAALAASAALAHAAVIALPVVLVELRRRRRRLREQGWELARSLAREDDARTESALVRERATMAGEIHDRLGHRLTLVSVQLGRLSLDPDLSPQSRAAVEEARAGVAEAAAELGETVQLLRTGDPVRSPGDGPLSDIVETARSAGLTVEGDLPPDLEGELSTHAYAALTRVLSEALANVAKHAPGEVARIAGRVADGRAVLTVANGRGAGGAAPPSGHGLPALHHRLALLGGTLEVEDADEHVLRATVPVDAVPGGDGGPEGTLAQVTRSRATAERRTRQMRRLTWLVPAGLAVAAVLVTVGFYLYFALASTLSPEQFARIEVGMTEHEAEEILPPVEMVEAPRGVLPEPEGASCRYHEAAVSLFVREEVFRTCLADGRVVSTDTIPPPGEVP